MAPNRIRASAHLLKIAACTLIAVIGIVFLMPSPDDASGQVTSLGPQWSPNRYHSAHIVLRDWTIVEMTSREGYSTITRWDNANRLWSVEIPSTISPTMIYAPPDLLLLADRDTASARSVEDGALVWQRPMSSTLLEHFPPPPFSSRTRVSSDDRTSMRVFDWRTGELGVQIANTDRRLSINGDFNVDLRSLPDAQPGFTQGMVLTDLTTGERFHRSPDSACPNCSGTDQLLAVHPDGHWFQLSPDAAELIRPDMATMPVLPSGWMIAGNPGTITERQLRGNLLLVTRFSTTTMWDLSTGSRLWIRPWSEVGRVWFGPADELLFERERRENYLTITSRGTLDPTTGRTRFELDDAYPWSTRPGGVPLEFSPGPSCDLPSTIYVHAIGHGELDLGCSGGDGDIVASVDPLGAPSLVTWADTDPIGARLSWDADYSAYPSSTNAFGTIVMHVSDDTHQLVPAKVDVVITDNAPTCVAKPLIVVLPGQEVDTLFGSCSDVDGDPIAYTYSSQGGTLDVSASSADHIRFIVPPDSHHGDLFTVNVAARSGARVTYSRISVEVSEAAPLCQPMTAMYVNDGAPVESIIPCAGSGPVTYTASAEDGWSDRLMVDDVTGIARFSTIVPFDAFAPRVVEFTVRDSRGLSASTTLSVHPIPAITCAGMEARTLHASPHTQTSIPPVCNVFIPNTPGNPLRLEVLAPPEHGDASVSPEGQMTYVPAEGFVGEDSFEIRGTQSPYSSAPVTIHVIVHDDAPCTLTGPASVQFGTRFEVDFHCSMDRFQFWSGGWFWQDTLPVGLRLVELRHPSVGRWLITYDTDDSVAPGPLRLAMGIIDGDLDPAWYSANIMLLPAELEIADDLPPGLGPGTCDLGATEPCRGSQSGEGDARRLSTTVRLRPDVRGLPRGRIPISTELVIQRFSVGRWSTVARSRITTRNGYAVRRTLSVRSDPDSRRLRVVLRISPTKRTSAIVVTRRLTIDV